MSILITVFGPLKLVILATIFQRGTRLQRRSLSDSWKYRDLLQQNDPTGRQRIHSYLTPTVEFNPTRTQDVAHNITRTYPIRDFAIRRPTTGGVTPENLTKM